ncbi:sterol 3-beta-glucosyltransferase UGT80A2 isoform X1 [Prunus yedoensis var. nudiflora]|uniref:Sterol 3-beta-glucosyltransferase UGT80A2 isoform X1 n=1 Tax=Prunus yedoensis var. nudiflora TaxID=2094558 RepID=A0A314Y7S0_PRUYE|nr:sterol 3-beta-glucosyltransferase UGT80A2 isoform X1 [Prunus yedoensis var. nudiflora]
MNLRDWGLKVDVVVFCFLDLASNYEPPDSLAEWLEAGEQPIYIGFDSLPLEEPEKMTNIILQALEITGQRGVINRGWGGLAFIYFSSQWQNQVHHGGAGTTAAGLKAAATDNAIFLGSLTFCPTTIVPFFWDQPFWGERVHARGVGPAPIPADEFSLEKLVDAIRFMLDPKCKLITHAYAQKNI